MNKAERAIFTFLKKDFDNHPPEKRTRFTAKDITEALKIKLPEVKKALNNLIKLNGHIFYYGGGKGECYRYRSKTRQQVEEIGHRIFEAKFGIKLKSKE